MKGAFPEFKFGMFLQAKYVVDYYNNKNRPECE